MAKFKNQKVRSMTIGRQTIFTMKLTAFIVLVYADKPCAFHRPIQQRKNQLRTQMRLAA